LDVLRDLKWINAHISAAAYPALEKRGELLPSRLRRDADTDDIRRSSSEAGGRSLVASPIGQKRFAVPLGPC